MPARAHVRLEADQVPLLLLVGQRLGHRALTTVGMPDPGLHQVRSLGEQTADQLAPVGETSAHCVLHSPEALPPWKKGPSWRSSRRTPMLTTTTTPAATPMTKIPATMTISKLIIGPISFHPLALPSPAGGAARRYLVVCVSTVHHVN